MRNKLSVFSVVIICFFTANAWAADTAAIQATVSKLQQQIQAVSQKMPQLLQQQTAATNASIAAQKKMTDASIAKLQAGLQLAAQNQQKQMQQQLDHLQTELASLQSSVDTKVAKLQTEIVALQKVKH